VLKALTVLATGVLVLVAGVHVAAASSPPTLALHGIHQAVDFSGTVRRSGPVGQFPGVPQCASVNCVHVALDVALPDNAFRGKPGGVQPTVEWHQKFNDILGLYVYRDGTFLGGSDAGVATFQSLRLNTPADPDSTADGQYDIYVAYEGYVDANGVAPSDTIGFTGWVQVQNEVPAQPVRDLLPNIIPLPTTDVSFTPVAIFGDFPDPNVPSCFHSEVVEHPGLTLCLRVQQRMYDENGPDRGPVEIDFDTPAGQTPAAVPASQRIYRSDGTSYLRPAGEVVYHPVHQHYHFEHYSQSNAFAIDANGNPVGAPVAQGQKNGFCLADTDIAARQHERYVAPMFYTAPNCLTPRSSNGVTDHYVEGEGTGNGDTYDADLPDQFLDASHLTDGTFIIRTVVDPDHKLLESNPHDNCIQHYVKLTGIGTGHPQATLLDTVNGHAVPACTS
jgi:lysyl oxidase